MELYSPCAHHVLDTGTSGQEVAAEMADPSSIMPGPMVWTPQPGPDRASQGPGLITCLVVFHLKHTAGAAPRRLMLTADTTCLLLCQLAPCSPNPDLAHPTSHLPRDYGARPTCNSRPLTRIHVLQAGALTREVCSALDTRHPPGSSSPPRKGAAGTKLPVLAAPPSCRSRGTTLHSKAVRAPGGIPGT